MTQNRNHRGFTLIELLVAFAVLSILLAVGVPSFVEMVRESRLSSTTRELAGALQLGRSEAIKRAELVTLCPRGPNDTCGEDWSEGWILFVDPSAENGDGIARIDAGDEVLGRADAVRTGLRVEVYGVRGSGTAPRDPARYLRFQPPGQTEWSAGNRTGSLLLCDEKRGGERSRVLNVQPSGDVRRGRPNAGERISRDARGLPIDCGTPT